MTPDFHTIESKMNTLFVAFEGLLPADQLQEMRELTAAGEPGISLENLCTQLYEFDIEVNSIQRRLIAEIGTAMKINSKYWKQLSPGNV